MKEAWAHVAKGCFAPACRGHKDTLRPTWTPPAQSVCNRLAAVRPTTLGSSFRVWAKPRPSFRHPTPKGCCRSFPTISFRTGLREQDPNKARVRISHFGGRCMVYHDTYRCRSWSWIEVRDRENCGTPSLPESNPQSLIGTLCKWDVASWSEGRPDLLGIRLCKLLIKGPCVDLRKKGCESSSLKVAEIFNTDAMIWVNSFESFEADSASCEEGAGLQQRRPWNTSSAWLRNQSYTQLMLQHLQSGQETQLPSQLPPWSLHAGTPLPVGGTFLGIAMLHSQLQCHVEST